MTSEGLTPETELRLHLGMARQYWLADRLDLALAAVRQALSIGVPAGDWYDFQRTVEAEWGARRDSASRRIGEHLILEADRLQWTDRLDSIEEIAVDAQHEVSEILGVRWAKPVLLTIITNDDWVAFMHARFGYYSERSESHKVCLPPCTVRSLRVFQAATRHEIGHAAINQLAGDSLPRWLHEGIAVNLERSDGREESHILSHAVSTGSSISLRAISAGFESFGVSIGSPDSLLCYAAASDFVRRMIEQSGWSSIHELLVRTRSSNDLERAFRARFREPLAHAEKRWQADLRTNSGQAAS